MATMTAGLGGPEGYGTNSFKTNGVGFGDLDDGAVFVDLSAAFPDGLTIGAATYSGLYINSNGSVTFGAPGFGYRETIASPDNPMIAPFLTDVDITKGGDIHWHVDDATGSVTITWHDVAPYWGGGANSFQLTLGDRGGGDFEVGVVYETIAYTGILGRPATAGVADGEGGEIAFPGSGDPGALQTYPGTDFGTGGPGGTLGFGFENGVADLAIIEGTAGADDIVPGVTDALGNVVGRAADLIDAGAGDDTIDAGAGNDTVLGGAGDDVILAAGGPGAGPPPAVTWTTVDANDDITGDSTQNHFSWTATNGSNATIRLNDSAAQGEGDTVADYVRVETTNQTGTLTIEDFDLGKDKIVLQEMYVGGRGSLSSGTIRIEITYANGNSQTFQILTDDTSFRLSDLFTTSDPVGADATGGSGAGNLIVNGSFETFSGGATAGWGDEVDTLPGWTDANGAPFRLLDSGRGGPAASDGENALDMQSSVPMDISQAVAGLTAGERYMLRFDMAQPIETGKSVNVYFGGALLDTIDPDDIDTWTSHGYAVVAGSGDGSDVLRFEAVADRGGVHGVRLDNVSLTAFAAGGDDDSLMGGDDADTFIVGDVFGNDTLIGGEGGTDDDLIDLSRLSGAVEVNYGADGQSGALTDGFDRVTFSEIERMLGSAQGDTIDAEAASGGVDIDGFGGDDLLRGGLGGDAVSGGSGRDTILGGAGDDRLRGGDGADFLKSGSGRDTLEGGLGDDTLMNAAGDDRLLGGDGDDLIVATQGRDTLDGGAGADTLMGGVDGDRLDGGADADLLLGDLAGVRFNESGTDGAGTASNVTDFPSTRLTFEVTFASTSVTDYPPLFSYATANQDDAFRVDARTGSIRVEINGVHYDTTVPESGLFDGNVHTLALTWDSATGALEVFVDGALAHSGVFQTGATIEQGGTVVLAQDQDSVGGGFASNQVFDGTIYGVRLYDDIRTPGEIEDAALGPVADTSDANLVANWVADPGSAGFTDLTGSHAMTLSGDVAATWSTGDDTMTGGDGADTLSGGGGDDDLDGGGGGDMIEGGAGADTISGGSGGGAGPAPLLELEFEDGSDGTASDSGGNGIDGTYQNGAAAGGTGWDGAGTALVLDRTDDHVLIPDNPAFQLTRGTISVRINTDDISTAGDDTIFSRDSETFDGGGHVTATVLGDGSVEVRLQSASSNVYLNSGPGTITDGQWHHVAVSFGPEGLALYVDGVAVDSDPHTGGIDGNNEPWVIGASQVYSGDGTAVNLRDHFGGRIDEFALYDRQLSPSDIATLETGGVRALAATTADDSLSGGDDADTFRVADDFGDDTILGGEGTTTGTDRDRVDFSAMTRGVTVTYTGDEAATATEGTNSLGFSEIEDLTLTNEADRVDATATTGGVDIDAGGGDDTIFGGAGGDTITGGQGSDYIEGGAGDDLLMTGTGSDTLRGGAGDDTLTNSDGDDLLDGGTGDDSIVATGGDDTLSGGAGDDTMSGGADDDLLVGGAGDDLMEGGAGDDTFLGDGANEITFSLGGTSRAGVNPAYEVYADGVLIFTGEVTWAQSTQPFDPNAPGAFEDVHIPVPGSLPDIVEIVFVNDGDPGDGSQGGDRNLHVDSLTVGDTTYEAETDAAANGGGAFGNNHNLWGSPNSLIFDTSGARPVSGTDTMSGGDGSDRFVFTDRFGDDSVVGGEGGVDDDVIDLSGLTGPVTVTYTGDEAGTITDGTDTITFSEIERLILTDQADVVDARGDSVGVDVEAGGGGDTVTGGSGNDTLDGGTGNDSLTGGDGDDVFVYDPGDGADTITDFNFGNSGPADDGNTANNDFIDLSAFYDSLIELRSDFDDDGVLNQSNDTANGGHVDYSNNSRMEAGDGITFEDARREDFTTDNTGVVCFAEGTRILTPRGAVPIELLRRGDRVVTRDNGPREIVWIGRRTLGTAALVANPKLRPIRLAPELTGGTAPLVVSPQHGVVLGIDGEERLVRATHLASMEGGRARVMQGCRRVTYLHLMFDAHQIVFADDAPAESFFPGPYALGALPRGALDEITSLFPGLRATGVAGAYGPTARAFVPRRALPADVRSIETCRG